MDLVFVSCQSEFDDGEACSFYCIVIGIGNMGCPCMAEACPLIVPDEHE